MGKLYDKAYDIENKLQGMAHKCSSELVGAYTGIGEPFHD
jgi:hypothetical protein